MLNWWRQQRELKHARESVRAAGKALRMHRDILQPQSVEGIAQATASVREAIKAKNVGALSGLLAKLEKQLEKAFPRQSYASLRENVEVFLVAAIVAMAVRTFFIQPFKIPTGSMQPTLYGIHPPEPFAPAPYTHGRPSVFRMIVGILFEGTMYQPDGYRSRGDHIFVDRCTYHFRKPRRGEIIVFDTTDIAKIPEGSRGKFYIKRLVAVGGDRVRVEPPRVFIDDKLLTGSAFDRIYSQKNGYNGYVLPFWDRANRIHAQPEFLNSNVSNEYVVPEKNLFVLGDNSVSSLDGRFWGSLPERALVGRAVIVYWPISSRLGPVD